MIVILHISAAKWSHANSQISNKQRSNLLANLKKEAFTNLEKKERNEKRRKKIAEASDFGDKLIRLNMIVSQKPNLSVAVG